MIADIPNEEDAKSRFYYPDTSGALLLICNTQFQPFTDDDWNAFQGCESKNPLIGYNRTWDQDVTIVIDGNVVNMLFDMDLGGGMLYKLNPAPYYERDIKEGEDT